MALLLRAFAPLLMVLIQNALKAHAHVEMKWPHPFRSQFDPMVTDPDYGNSSPLVMDGSNYPCKGHQNLASSQVSQVTYKPGQTYNITLARSATYEGGSCQISLSHDNGQSFKVIKSMIGGCLLREDWDFTIPSNAPASNDAILAWTWFNLIGNREMYMNCARVAIAGQSVRRYQRYQGKRQRSLRDFPDIFVCNIGNGCMTVEKREVVFPNPGPDVETNTIDVVALDTGPGFSVTTTPTGNAFSSDASNATRTTELYPMSNATATYIRSTGIRSSNSAYFNRTSWLTGIGQSSFSTFASSISITLTATPRSVLTLPDTGSTSSPTTTIGTLGTTTTTTTTSKAGTATISVSSADSTTSSLETTMSSMSLLSGYTLSSQLSASVAFATSASASTPSTPVTTFGATVCTPGSFTCNSPTTFSQCVPDSSGSGMYMFMGLVAAGTHCVDGAIERVNAGSCSPSGTLRCNGSMAFYLCDQGGLIDMGSVAPGTTCRDGVIVSS